MTRKRLAFAFGVSLLLAFPPGASAKRIAIPTPPPPPPPEKDEGFEDLRAEIKQGEALVILRDGSRIAGRPAASDLVVATPFGELRIPASEARWARIGKAADPRLKERIAASIARLGDSSFEEREKAAEELKKMGLSACRELEAAARSADEEVKTRAEALLKDLEDDLARETPLRDEDEVETDRFRVVGQLKAVTIKIETAHGALDVEKPAIDRILWPLEDSGAAEVKVSAQYLAGYGYFHKTRLHVKKGDRLKIRASGEVTILNGGVKFGPDGLPANYGMYEPEIPMGALIGRIGASGKVFKTGPSCEITAQESGPVYLALAFPQPVYYQFTGEFRVRAESGESGAAPSGEKDPIPQKGGGTDPKAGSGGAMGGGRDDATGQAMVETALKLSETWKEAEAAGQADAAAMKRNLQKIKKNMNVDQLEEYMKRGGE